MFNSINIHRASLAILFSMHSQNFFANPSTHINLTIPVSFDASCSHPLTNDQCSNLPRWPWANGSDHWPLWCHFSNISRTIALFGQWRSHSVWTSIALWSMYLDACSMTSWLKSSGKGPENISIRECYNLWWAMWYLIWRFMDQLSLEIELESTLNRLHEE